MTEPQSDLFSALATAAAHGDLQSFRAHLTADCLYRDVPQQLECRGDEAAERLFGALRGGRTIELLNAVETDDRAVWELVVRGGEQTETVPGLRTAAVCQLRDGAIAEVHLYYDRATLLAGAEGE